MTARLLLDEMLSGTIAEQLRALDHDVTAVVDDPTLIGKPDIDVVTRATNDNRAVVTRNVKDFVVLDSQIRAQGQSHAGIVLVTTKAFPEDRQAIGALVRALDSLLENGGLTPNRLHFLQR